MTNILLVSEDYIKSNSGVSDNLFGKFLLPAIREAQDIDLQPVLGTELYKSILSKVDNGSIMEEPEKKYKELLDEYIQPVLLYKVLSNTLPIIGTKIANLGAVKTDDEKATNISPAERDRLETYYAYRSGYYVNRLMDYLKANYNDYPELSSCKPVKPNLKNNVECPIFLGGSVNKHQGCTGRINR